MTDVIANRDWIGWDDESWVAVDSIDAFEPNGVGGTILMLRGGHRIQTRESPAQVQRRIQETGATGKAPDQ